MDEKAIQLVLSKLDELGRTYGPAFTEQAIKYAHIKAIENVVVPLVVCMIAAFITRVFYKQSKRTTFDSFYHEMVCPTIAIFAGLISVAGLLESLDVAAWYGLFDPAAYLSYRLFDKVL